MRRRLGLLGVLAMLVALVPAVSAPVGATEHDQVAVSVFADEFRTEVALEPIAPELTSWAGFEARINADDAGLGGLEIQDTESAVLFLESGATQPEPVQIQEFGNGPDRWTGGEARLEGSRIVVDLNAGTEPLLCGDTIAQIVVTVIVGIEDPPIEIDLRDVAAQDCPVVADLEGINADDGYLFDQSGNRFGFVGDSRTYVAGILNEGPDAETETRFDFRIDYFGIADNPVLGTDFTWTLEPACTTFNSTAVAPTALCDNLGPLAAGATVTKSFAVDWLMAGEYVIATMVYEKDPTTLDPDDFQSVNVQFLTHRLSVIDPGADADADGIDNGIDRSTSGWDPFTSSDAFDDAHWGGGTSGTIVTGTASVADAVDPADGVDVTTSTGGATLDACGSQLALAADTTATITCGSITVSVVSGEVEVTLDDGSTLTLGSGDSATVDASSVSVHEGDAEITPEGGGDPITVPAGETWTPDGTDSDGDGVPDSADVCPDTDVENDETFDLKPNHYYLADHGEFVDRDGEPAGITVEDTGGCSASQIIESAGLGKGHERFGITMSALMDWIAGLGD